MILVILYTGAGLYLLLMLSGLLHRDYMKEVNRNRRRGMMILAIGLILLGLYTTYYYYGKHDPEPSSRIEGRREKREGGTPSPLPPGP